MKTGTKLLTGGNVVMPGGGGGGGGGGIMPLRDGKRKRKFHENRNKCGVEKSWHHFFS